MNYLAKIELQNRLAPLPSSVAVGRKHETVSGVLGSDNADLSALRSGAFHQNFANWRSDLDGIGHFTRRYGPLDWEGELVGPRNANGLKFWFLAEIWRERQTEIRKLWETARTEGPMGPTWLTSGSAGDFPIAYESDRYAQGARLREETGELIYQAPETLWAATSDGPTGYLVAQTTWQYLVLLLTFEKLNSLRKCENSGCTGPYFIARRKDQVFCGGDCARLVVKRRWWRLHGKEWRQAKSQMKRRKKP